MTSLIFDDVLTKDAFPPDIADELGPIDRHVHELSRWQGVSYVREQEGTAIGRSLTRIGNIDVSSK